VRKYRDFWRFIADEITAIDKAVMVDDEPELAIRIKEVEDRKIFLVAVTPSSDLTAFNEDNYGDVDTCVIYVLMKVDPRDETPGDIMDEREKTQNAMNEVRRLMLDLEERCDDSYAAELMKQVIRGKQHIDRERNYLGCNGYSLSFSVKTNGI